MRECSAAILLKGSTQQLHPRELLKTRKLRPLRGRKSKKEVYPTTCVVTNLGVVTNPGVVTNLAVV